MVIHNTRENQTNMKTLIRMIKLNTVLILSLISPLMALGQAHGPSIAETLTLDKHTSIPLHKHTSVQMKSGTITGLYAVKSEERAFLIWYTEGATNDGIFTVERSKDGIAFEPIGIKDCLPSKAAIRLRYSFVDAEPGVGQVYYRLTQYALNLSVMAVETVVLTKPDWASLIKRD